MRPMITDSQVFVASRLNVPGAWQMPQVCLRILLMFIVQHHSSGNRWSRKIAE